MDANVSEITQLINSVGFPIVCCGVLFWNNYKLTSTITELTYKTIDVNSDIEISTNGKLPLDTLIKVVKLTGGTDYENITKILNSENIVMYDLKLFSNTLNSSITRLDSGKFEVKIPVPDSLNGKELIVYYVDSNNNIEEYDVHPMENYIKW